MIPARNVTGKPRRDSLRNEEIRNRVNTNKLQEDFEITWVGRPCEANEDRLLKMGTEKRTKKIHRKAKKMVDESSEDRCVQKWWTSKYGRANNDVNLGSEDDWQCTEYSKQTSLNHGTGMRLEYYQRRNSTVKDTGHNGLTWYRQGVSSLKPELLCYFCISRHKHGFLLYN